MSRMSYGLVATAIFFIYLGLSIALYSTGTITDILLLFAGLLTLIGVWTLIYGIFLGEDLIFWISNGSFITLISLAFFTYKYTANIGIAFAVVMIGVGLLIIMFLLKKP
ncbi:MAG TPA: hypothetical protein EYP16_07470 [Candidatus Atribacteria bacterium]|nr:hypothetical protein [Candidatus Atribacteria bacterium]